MTHGPSITVYDLTVVFLQKNKSKISDIFLELDIGSLEERKCVFEYITNMLLEKFEENNYMFAFWNHKPDQEVEDYDVLCDLFEEYGKILSAECNCLSIVRADYRDYKLICEDQEYYLLTSKDVNDTTEYINKLRLKSDIRKGKEAEEELKKLENKIKSNDKKGL